MPIENASYRSLIVVLGALSNRLQGGDPRAFVHHHYPAQFAIVHPVDRDGVDIFCHLRDLHPLPAGLAQINAVI